MNTLPPWSYSMLEKFENCPKSAFHRYILKEKEPETEAIRYGNEVHKAMELRVKDGAILPEIYRSWEIFAASISRSEGKIYTEYKMGISRDFKPCSFFGGNVWGRGAADVLVINGPSAWIGDYKTGKKREKELQLQILAMFAFKEYPELEKITGCNIWLKTNEIGTPFMFTRGREAEYWADILPRLQKMEKALETMNWPERPSGLCGWCAVTSCRFNRK